MVMYVLSRLRSLCSNRLTQFWHPPLGGVVYIESIRRCTHRCLNFSLLDLLSFLLLLLLLVGNSNVEYFTNGSPLKILAVINFFYTKKGWIFYFKNIVLLVCTCQVIRKNSYLKIWWLWIWIDVAWQNLYRVNGADRCSKFFYISATL